MHAYVLAIFSLSFLCMSLWGGLCPNYSVYICAVLRYNDPLYVKYKRLDLLVDIASESNARPIIDEIRYHCYGNLI